MGKIPDQLRQTIAANIRACRLKKFPGRGGSQECAKAFGVSPQQWSPWERGMRTPDETRLERMAEFFSVTVEWLRRDHTKPPPDTPPPPNACPPPGSPPLPDGIAGLDFPLPPSWEPDPPGGAASFFWLARYLAACMGKNGIKVDVRLDNQTLEQLVRLLKSS